MPLLGLRIPWSAARRGRQRICYIDSVDRCLLTLCYLLAVALAGCSSGDEPQTEESGEVIVFAAASLSESFAEIARRFEIANRGVTVVLNLAGSQQLAHQLSQGAPAEVFASADEGQMAAAIEVGRVVSGKQQRFASNELSLILPASNPAGLRTLSDLALPGLKLVLAAPEVPAGHYAELLLNAAEEEPGFGPVFKEGVLANVVSYEENVRAVLSKVQLGEADAGIVYRSDVVPRLTAEIKQLPIPAQLNIPAAYTIAPVADGQSPQLARKFIDFVLGAEGQKVLSANGLVPVTAE